MEKATHNPATKEEDRLEQTTNPGQLHHHLSPPPAPHCKAATSPSLPKPALQKPCFVFPVWHWWAFTESRLSVLCHIWDPSCFQFSHTSVGKRKTALLEGLEGVETWISQLQVHASFSKSIKLAVYCILLSVFLFLHSRKAWNFCFHFLWLSKYRSAVAEKTSKQEIFISALTQHRNRIAKYRRCPLS